MLTKPSFRQLAFALGGALAAIVIGYNYLPVPLGDVGPVLGVAWMAAIGAVSGLFLKGMFGES